MLICEQCNCEVQPFDGVHLTGEGGTLLLLFEDRLPGKE